MLNDTTLLIVQTYYGAFNFPKGETSGEKNALLIAINENLKDNVDLIAKEVLAEIVGPWQV